MGLLDAKLRQWSSEAVELINNSLGPESNLLYDYLPPVSTMFAGTFNALTCRRVGKLLLYSFNLRVVPDDCLDVSTALNRQHCLEEYREFFPLNPSSSVSPSLDPSFPSSVSSASSLV